MITRAHAREICKPVSMNWNMLLVDLKHCKREAGLPSPAFAC